MGAGGKVPATSAWPPPQQCSSRRRRRICRAPGIMARTTVSRPDGLAPLCPAELPALPGRPGPPRAAPRLAPLRPVARPAAPPRFESAPLRRPAPPRSALLCPASPAPWSGPPPGPPALRARWAVPGRPEVAVPQSGPLRGAERGEVGQSGAERGGAWRSGAGRGVAWRGQPPGLYFPSRGFGGFGGKRFWRKTSGTQAVLSSS